MYEIDTSALDSWADPDSVETAAADISAKGAAVRAAVFDVRVKWLGLGRHYDSPSTDNLLSVFDEILKHGDYVKAGAEEAEGLLKDFAGEIRNLQLMGTGVLQHVATFQESIRTQDWTEPTAHAEAEQGRRYYQSLVDSLQTNYQNAEGTCANGINELYAEVKEEYGGINGPWGGLVLGLGTEATGFIRQATLAQPVYQYRQPPVDIDAAYTRHVMPDGTRYLMPRAGYTPPLPERYLAGWHKPMTVSALPEDGHVGYKVPGWAKNGGRALGVLGAVFTLEGEYATSYNENKQEHPEWSEDKLENEAGQDLVVRGGAKVGAAALTGAAIGAAVGSIVPIAGTAAGALIGVGVGALVGVVMEWSGINDGIADAAEDLYEWAVPEGAQEVVGDVGDGIREAWDWAFGD